MQLPVFEDLVLSAGLIWRAAVFSVGVLLASAAAAVIASHVMLPLTNLSRRAKALLSTGAAIVVAGMIVVFGPVHRPFDLTEANLSGQSLVGKDLTGADLSRANLTGANLFATNLNGADLSFANLSGADLSVANLTVANLTGADLSRANLSGADLSVANLSDANLSGANLSGANLTGTKLDKACGNADTKLPGGLTLKAC